MQAILERILMNIKEINPPGREHRREFINTHETMLLFKVRGETGIATHYILVKEWYLLSFNQMKEVRQKYQQVVF